MAYKPEIVVKHTYDDSTIVWRHTPDDDREAFAATIASYESTLEPQYKVTVDLDDEDEMRMRIAYKQPSTASARQVLKGIANQIISDTIWGGGPG